MATGSRRGGRGEVGVEQGEVVETQKLVPVAFPYVFLIQKQRVEPWYRGDRWFSLSLDSLLESVGGIQYYAVGPSSGGSVVKPSPPSTRHPLSPTDLPWPDFTATFEETSVRWGGGESVNLGGGEDGLGAPAPRNILLIYRWSPKLWFWSNRWFRPPLGAQLWQGFAIIFTFPNPIVAPVALLNPL